MVSIKLQPTDRISINIPLNERGENSGDSNCFRQWAYFLRGLPNFTPWAQRLC